MKPVISVIIPVLNEQVSINGLISHLRLIFDTFPIEIIVVDGCDHQETLSVIQDPHVLKIGSAKGRGVQMIAGAEKASGNYLLFLHADTRLPATALSDVLSMGNDKKTAACAFDLSIDDSHPVFRLIETMVNVRSRAMGLPFGDQALCVKREWYDTVCGFRPYPLMEDVDLVCRLKRRKGRIRMVSSKVTTSARRWRKEGIVFCTVRNWMILFLFFGGIRPEVLKRFYNDDGR